MIITALSGKYQESFVQLLLDYLPEVDADIPEDVVRGKLLDLLCSQQDQRILSVSLLLSDEVPVGFSVYQIDSPASDWCKRPGWGCIREFYIAPGHRRRGFGAAMASDTESRLRQLGAQQLYLTSDGGIPFWRSQGWQLKEEAASNGLNFLEK